eukprot:31232-Pelagococcus_subviridis.AAC.11
MLTAPRRAFLFWFREAPRPLETLENADAGLSVANAVARDGTFTIRFTNAKTRLRPSVDAALYGSFASSSSSGASSRRCRSRHSGAPPMRPLPATPLTAPPPPPHSLGSCDQTQTPCAPATASVAPAIGRHASARAP